MKPHSSLLATSVKLIIFNVTKLSMKLPLELELCIRPIFSSIGLARWHCFLFSRKRRPVRGEEEIKAGASREKESVQMRAFGF